MLWRTALRAAAQAAETAAATAAEGTASRARKATFFDLALTVPNLGVGAKLGRAVWLRYPKSYIEVTKVKPTKVRHRSGVHERPVRTAQSDRSKALRWSAPGAPSTELEERQGMGPARLQRSGSPGHRATGGVVQSTGR